MGEERSLLQQIGEKERELNIRLKEIADQTDSQIAAARKESAETIVKADEAGKKAAAEYLEKERITTTAEIASIKNAGEQDVANIMMQGEPNISRVSSEIVRRVVLK